MKYKKNIIKNKKKIIVAMSGGVDSSVSALILKNKGYNVEGLFMINWINNTKLKKCSIYKDLIDVKKVCKKIGIKLHIVNFSFEYWNLVFKNLLINYKKGLTPNPDIICNKEIKFKLFFKYSINNLKSNFISTGHYVRNIFIKKKCLLLKGIDKNKDQSYFLYMVKNKYIKKCIFPLGNLTKNKVRNIAKKFNLHIYNKKDSMGICFIGKYKFRKFIKKYLKCKNGYIYNINKKKIGIHEGSIYYTIGQRKGLKIKYSNNKKYKPWYVIKKSIKKNIIYACEGCENKYLMYKEFLIKKIYWINKIKKFKKFKCKVKIRSNQIYDINCIIIKKNNNFIIKLKKYIKSISPGQSAVFYIKDNCLGGGIITKSFPIKKIKLN